MSRNWKEELVVRGITSLSDRSWLQLCHRHARTSSRAEQWNTVLHPLSTKGSRVVIASGKGVSAYCPSKSAEQVCCLPLSTLLSFFILLDQYLVCVLTIGAWLADFAAPTLLSGNGDAPSTLRFPFAQLLSSHSVLDGTCSGDTTLPYVGKET